MHGGEVCIGGKIVRSLEGYDGSAVVQLVREVGKK